MSAENVVQIVGNLAEDPELRFTPDGAAVANLRVGVNQRFFNRESNQWESRLDGFFTIVVWRTQAEQVADCTKKGDRVQVSGRLRNRSFEDRDGVTRYKTEIHAEEVGLSLRFPSDGED